jgi:hypothetical protein
MMNDTENRRRGGLTMCASYARYLASCVVLVVVVGFVQATFAADILIADAKSEPESLTMAPGGMLIVGSASSPFVYKVRPGSSTAEKFIDASVEGPGTFFLGMLADAASNTLWTCQLTPVPNTTPAQRHTALRGFDLATGAPKMRWNLPGDSNVCNDFTIGPDKALYITDTIPGRIFSCRPEHPPRNFTWSMRLLGASMASPSWMARSM